MTISDNISQYGTSVPKIVEKEIINKYPEKRIGMTYGLKNLSKGYFHKSSGIDAIRNNLNNLLKTIKGERFMLPNYGCDLRQFLMEPLDDVTFEEVRDEIIESINKYMSGIIVNRIQIFETKNYMMRVNLFCSIPAENINNVVIKLEL